MDNNTTTVPPSPTSNTSGWPGALKIYKSSKAAIMLNINTFIKLIGAYVLLVIVNTILRATILKSGLLTSLIEFLIQIIYVLISAAIIYVTIMSVRGVVTELEPAAKKVYENALNVLFVSLLTGVVAVVSIMVFTVPFFFVFPRIVFALYYVLDQGKDPIDAIKASWNLTNGHIGKVYGIIGVYFLIGLLMLTIIGIPVAIYFAVMYSASFAVLYEYLLHNKNPLAPAAVTTTTQASPIIS